MLWDNCKFTVEINSRKMFKVAGERASKLFEDLTYVGSNLYFWSVMKEIEILSIDITFYNCVSA